jgi:hypothetical protein
MGFWIGCKFQAAFFWISSPCRDFSEALKKLALRFWGIPIKPKSSVST